MIWARALIYPSHWWAQRVDVHESIVDSARCVVACVDVFVVLLHFQCDVCFDWWKIISAPMQVIFSTRSARYCKATLLSICCSGVMRFAGRPVNSVFLFFSAPARIP